MWHKGIHPNTIEFIHGDRVDFEGGMTKHERTDWKKNRDIIGHALMELFPVFNRDMALQVNTLENHYLKEKDEDWFGHESRQIVRVYHPFVEAYVHWYKQCYDSEKDAGEDPSAVPPGFVFDLACLFPSKQAPPLHYASRYHQLLIKIFGAKGRKQWHVDERQSNQIPKWAINAHKAVHSDLLNDRLEHVKGMVAQDIKFFL